jgi:hypothetical protein
MADIFISYASVDRPFARRLADALEAHGWPVWWDYSNLHSGEHFDRAIEKAIRGARVVIVVWSKTSVESAWVRDEATLALEESKLVPLRIDTARLPMRFRNIHTIDLSSWTAETEAEPLERLVKDLGHYLGPPNSSNWSGDPGIPTAPHSRTATPVGEDQQPAEGQPIAERSHAAPSSGVRPVSISNVMLNSPVSLRACLTDSPRRLLRSGERRSGCGQTRTGRNTRIAAAAIRAT